MNAAKCDAADYINFLVASPRVVSGTEAARVRPDQVNPPAHDAFTRLLHRLEPDPGTLWAEAAPQVRRDGGILVRDILPNVVAPLIVTATLGLGGAILSAAALSFLGLGSQPPQPEWGRMLSEGRDYLREAWWISTFPGLGILLTVLAMNLVGDGLRDVLDPRLKT